MKPIYLLDTNVISEFLKPRPNSAVIRAASEKRDVCAICSVVWQESVFGYEKMPEGKRKEHVGEYLLKIKSMYSIIPYDSFAAQICGELQARCEERGVPVPRYDSQIAATAIANNMILITHNTADYEALQENSMLHVEDWWE